MVLNLSNIHGFRQRLVKVGAKIEKNYDTSKTNFKFVLGLAKQL